MFKAYTTQMKIILLGVLALVLVGCVIYVAYLYNKASSLEKDNESLATQVTQLTSDLEDQAAEVVRLQKSELITNDLIASAAVAVEQKKDSGSKAKASAASAVVALPTTLPPPVRASAVSKIRIDYIWLAYCANISKQIQAPVEGCPK